MKLDLRQFAEFPAVATVHLNRGEVSPVAEEVRETGPLEIRLSIQKGTEEYYCNGEVTGELVLECARCLSAFAGTVKEDVTFVACSAQFASAIAKEALDDEEYVLFAGSDEVIEMTEPVRQALLVALPMMPLCSEECKGLCPTCGVNRNSQNCGCQTEAVDVRWEALAQVKQKMEKKEVQE